MNKRVWIVFVVLQSLGLVCFWSWGRGHTAVGPLLWTVSFVLLLPGNVVGGWLAQQFFWEGGLKLTQLAVIENFCAVAINAVVWMVCARIVRAIRSGRVVRPQD